MGLRMQLELTPLGPTSKQFWSTRNEGLEFNTIQYNTIQYNVIHHKLSVTYCIVVFNSLQWTKSMK